MSEDKDMWIYHGKCYPKNLPQFPLPEYLYIGQTNDPENRPEQHMTEDKNNPKFELLRSLTSPEDWEFKFRRVERREGESQKNYMNRVGIQEKNEIRDFETNYCRHGWGSYGLNASDGGEHPGNGGVRCSIPGETSGLKNICYISRGYYLYQKHFWKNGKRMPKGIFRSKNPFLCFLYAEFSGEKDIIVDEKIFWYNVLKWWNIDIYESKVDHDYLGIKNVSIRSINKGIRGYDIRCQKRIKGKFVSKTRVLFSDFLQLYKDGILDVNDIYCLDFFVWNANLILESKFDIKNHRPDVFYADFFEFRKIHHFSVDDLGAAIKFLKKVESAIANSLPIGQQTLQCN